MKRLSRKKINKAIEEIAESYSEEAVKNSKAHKKEFGEISTCLKNLQAFFLITSTVLTPEYEPKHYKGRFEMCMGYMLEIGNSFQVIQILFERGFHIQMQMILRCQFEYVNNLIAFVGDESFYDRYCKEKKLPVPFFTPKPDHTLKSIKRIFKKVSPDNYQEIWSIYTQMSKIMYKNLSMIAHGNIPALYIHSHEGTKNDETVNRKAYGVSYPLNPTVVLLNSVLKYFTLTKSILFVLLMSNKLANQKDEIFPYAVELSEVNEIGKSVINSKRPNKN